MAERRRGGRVHTGSPRHLAGCPIVPALLHRRGCPFAATSRCSRSRTRASTFHGAARSLRPFSSRSPEAESWGVPRSGTHSMHILERVAGHIGYVVVPEFRRQGYATEMLRLSLQIARDTVRWCPSRSRDLRRRQCRVNPDHRKERGHSRERRQWTGPRQAETPLLD